MRVSLFEKLKKRKICFIKEIKKINNLLIQFCDDTHLFYSEAFKISPFAVYYVNFDDAMRDLIEIDGNYCLYSDDDFGFFLDRMINLHVDLTLDSFLDYLEFFWTLFNSNRKSRYLDANAKQIALIVYNDCEKLGYTFKNDDDNEEVFKVMLKNPETEAVALQVKENTRDKIYRYLMIRNGKVNDKRECIKSLADDVEVICKKYSSIKEYGKLKHFIQCVRHTKDTPKKEYPFYYEDEEKWLDKIFDMIIGILSFTKTKEIVEEIVKLESN